MTGLAALSSYAADSPLRQCDDVARSSGVKIGQTNLLEIVLALLTPNRHASGRTVGNSNAVRTPMFAFKSAILLALTRTAGVEYARCSLLVTLPVVFLLSRRARTYPKVSRPSRLIRFCETMNVL